jgi:Fe-S cluster biogenesis protein NfuA
MGFYIHVQETPNPNAVKFISQYAVRTDGKSNYHSVDEAQHCPLAVALFGLPGVRQLFFYDNYVTVTRDEAHEWDDIVDPILDLLQRELPSHNPNYVDPEGSTEDIDVEDTPETAAINEILDRTVRPYLAADGGGIVVQKREGKFVFVRYQGACGSCPSSIGGTLQAIQNILRQEIDEEIEVIETGSAGQMYMW